MKFDIWSFEKRPLPEILSFVVDNRGKTVPTAENGHILIATNCIRNENLYPSYEKVRYLNEETYQNWFRSHPKPGDILFVCKGTPGRVCMVPDLIDFCIAQDMVALRANETIVYNKYLLAVLRSVRIQKQIEQTSVGDVIPHFKKSFFDQLLIPIPPMQIQKIIGDYYFAFSEKVEINKKINNNLEQQAQAIFKSWFIDFEPFNKSMPSDWTIGTIDDLAKEVVCGKTPSTKKAEYYGSDIPFITIPDMHGKTYTVTTERYLSKLGASSQEKKTLPKNSICVSCIGTAGLVTLVAEESQTNQQINSIIPKNGFSSYYIYLLMQTLSDTINKLGQSGSTIVNLNKSQFGKIQVIIPALSAMIKFDEIVSPMFEKILQNQIVNIKLTSLRDTLLPKLMSGELDVSDIEL